jgi:hypothetical protein
MKQRARQLMERLSSRVPASICQQLWLFLGFNKVPLLPGGDPVAQCTDNPDCSRECPLVAGFVGLVG